MNRALPKESSAEFRDSSFFRIFLRFPRLVFLRPFYYEEIIESSAEKGHSLEQEMVLPPGPSPSGRRSGRPDFSAAVTSFRSSRMGNDNELRSFENFSCIVYKRASMCQCYPWRPFFPDPPWKKRPSLARRGHKRGRRALSARQGGMIMKSSGKLNAFLNGAGFYIVLLLAIAVIGASGYFIYTTLSGNRDAQADPAPAGNEAILSEEPEHEVPDTPSSGTTEISAEVSAPTETQVQTIVRPLSGDTVTAFSMDELLYNETMGDWRTHDGIDIAAAEGAEVVAAASGKVSSVTEDYWMGTTVVISCADGYELTYASLQSAPAVSAGDSVQAGDPIGTVGNTSSLEETAGAHLHFSVYREGTAVDPNAYLAKAG